MTWWKLKIWHWNVFLVFFPHVTITHKSPINAHSDSITSLTCCACAHSGFPNRNDIPFLTKAMGLRWNAMRHVWDVECKSVTYVWIWVCNKMSGFTETWYIFIQLMLCQCKVGCLLWVFVAPSLQFPSLESRSSPGAMPDMEGIGLSFGLFVFHWKQELSDSDDESEWVLLVHGDLSSHWGYWICWRATKRLLLLFSVK